MDATPSPFDDTPEADPRSLQTRQRWATVEKPKLDPLGNSGAKRKRTDLNPFQRRWFERHGWTFYRAEKANAFGSVSQDMWQCADYIACKPGVGIMLVQTTDWTSVSKRFKKAEAAPEIPEWLAAGGSYEVHGWEKVGARWRVRRFRLVREGEALVRREVVDAERQPAAEGE